MLEDDKEKNSNQEKKSKKVKKTNKLFFDADNSYKNSDLDDDDSDIDNKSVVTATKLSDNGAYTITDVSDIKKTSTTHETLKAERPKASKYF